jgi:hypothetical protein
MPHPTCDPYRLTLIHGEGRGSGRHALDEDALLTPIYAALCRGTRRRPAPVDPVERFRRDPLTAPIPVAVPSSRRPGAHAATPRREPERTGRHHLRRLPARLPH